ncbi:MAG: hypothetical protein H7831_16365 [Magnetococcus sp. WYHC-3]
MITISQTFDDEQEARDALSWRAAYLIIDFALNRLREIYKYQVHGDETIKMAEALRAEIIEECNEHGVRWG